MLFLLCPGYIARAAHKVPKELPWHGIMFLVKKKASFDAVLYWGISE